MTAEDEKQLVDLQHEVNRLFTVLEANAILSSTLNLEQVLDNLMSKAREVMEAEASSLMLLDEATDELYFHTIKGDKSEALRDIRLKLGEGIAGWVAKEGKPVLVEDCSKDPRFFKKADSISQFHTRSMMCMPLKSKKRILGTVQVLNKIDGSFFSESDLKVFQVLANQAAIAIENARLYELATTDSMTGLFLKHYFLARMAEEYKRFKQQSVPMSLIMSDIDFFKKVNTEFGHPGGDAALIELARIIRQTLSDYPKETIPGRYGGEEFCVLLPEIGPEEALAIGEIIRSTTESHPIKIGDAEAHITISIGVASLPLHGGMVEKADDLIEVADKALYICKDRGRNCVTLFQ